MHSNAASFLLKSGQKAADLEHRRKINFNIGKYNAAVPAGKRQFQELETARMWAKNTKWEALEKLDIHLLEFEKQARKRGTQVIWAANAQEALDAVGQICSEHHCTTVVKSKSMVTEEIKLNPYLENRGIESVETDLGEYIQQLDGETPYHIVTPAMHKSKEDVARLFTEKLGTPEGLTPSELTMVAREKLRQKYVEAQVGITGANFLISATGSIALTENEGNGRLTCAFPQVHIAIAGIEKVLPRLSDLALFWPLLSTFGTGQQITTYNSIISGPRQEGELNGPEKMYVILLDNGRTTLMADAKAREALYCIRCGACLNACPVYKNIGGHSYETTYSGPIGKVITPWLRGNDYKHLSYASSLCGNCTEVCPVKINLHELLLHNRQQSVEKGKASLAEIMAWKSWRLASLHRPLMNTGSAELKNKVVNYLFRGWTKYHTPLNFKPETFNEWWKQNRK